MVFMGCESFYHVQIQMIHGKKKKKKKKKEAYRVKLKAVESLSIIFSLFLEIYLILHMKMCFDNDKKICMSSSQGSNSMK